MSYVHRAEWPAEAVNVAAQFDQKRFATLKAKLALLGHALHRTSPEDGPVRLFCQRWGMVRHMADLDAVAAFLGQVGGAE